MSDLARRIAITIGALLIFRFGFFLPLALAAAVFGQTPWLATAYAQLSYGKPLYIVPVSIAVFALAFIYSSIRPRAGSRARRRDPAGAGGHDTGCGAGGCNRRPSRPHRVVDDRRRSRLPRRVSLIPAVQLASGPVLPYNFGGGSVLIVVCTILDLKKQVRDLSLTNRGGERI
ncbi:hypothetical protein [Bradyrhizobium semiaridum]|uniref:hypothetical protein n=1 Tax=Bradyrhizobium semiaridum TaxID=2821404 RepID=UPI00201C099C|nr:hypothetical protein [Bradyrhizobium semiaridum]